LRVELDLQFTGQILAHELVVLAHIGRHHLLHLPGLQQQPQAEIIDARIVRGNRQVLYACVPDRHDQVFRYAAQAEPPCRDQHAVEQHALQRLRCASVDFLHGFLRYRLPGFTPEALNSRAPYGSAA
jgi:hypothetical protein